MPAEEGRLYTCKSGGVDLAITRDYDKTHFAARETEYWAIWRGGYFMDWMNILAYLEIPEIKQEARRHVRRFVH